MKKIEKYIRIECETKEHLPLDEIETFQGNLKTLSKESYEKLKNEILNTGFAFPLFVWKQKNKNYILSGHQRFFCLRRLREDGYSVPDVPIVYVHAPTVREAKRRILQEVAQYGEVDRQGFYEFIVENDFLVSDIAESFNIPEVSMDMGDFAGEFFNEASADTGTEDDIPEVVDAKTKLGQVYQLGAHRLMCGDSTNPNHVAKLMNGKKASLWSSDPPYGINHVEVSQEKGQSKGYEKIANDELQDEALKDFIFNAITVSLPHMNKGFAFYMWHAMKMQAYFSQAAAAAGILFHRQIIWAKPQFVFGRGHYHWRHELCLMGWLTGNEPDFNGPRNQDTIWNIGRENDKIHPTQKPVELFAIPIRNHIKKGEIVYEPFAGSGSGMIAAEIEGVSCYAMELAQHYCDVIIARWEAYTGQKAVLVSA